jgi:hypothetical protein
MLRSCAEPGTFRGPWNNAVPTPTTRSAPAVLPEDSWRQPQPMTVEVTRANFPNSSHPFPGEPS